MAFSLIFDDGDITGYDPTFLKRFMDPVDDGAVYHRYTASAFGTGFVHRRVVDNADDDEWLRRSAKRSHAIRCAQNSFWHKMVLVLVSTGELKEETTPMAPDPEDRTMTKKQWDNFAMEWGQRERKSVILCVWRSAAAKG